MMLGLARSGTMRLVTRIAGTLAVAAALQQLGYRGLVKKADGGGSYVESSANGQAFTIDLYDCKDGHCGSLQFQSFYKAEPLFTLMVAPAVKSTAAVVDHWSPRLYINDGVMVNSPGTEIGLQRLRTSSNHHY